MPPYDRPGYMPVIYIQWAILTKCYILSPSTLQSLVISLYRTICDENWQYRMEFVNVRKYSLSQVLTIQNKTTWYSRMDLCVVKLIFSFPVIIWLANISLTLKMLYKYYMNSLLCSIYSEILNNQDEQD